MATPCHTPMVLAAGVGLAWVGGGTQIRHWEIEKDSLTEAERLGAELWVPVHHLRPSAREDRTPLFHHLHGHMTTHVGRIRCDFQTNPLPHVILFYA
jgi:hypothetical protein